MNTPRKPETAKDYRSLALSVAVGAAVCIALPRVLYIVGEVASDLLTFGGATLAGAPVSALFLSFLVYGFVGWAYESTVCALSHWGRFANSGFLLGPCCPIYGVGALVCWFLLRGIESTPLLFFAAALVCSAIEYLVGVLLEAVTHARFWDYSNKPFNIHGRVCLYGAILFGAGCTVVCRVAEPALLYLFSLVPSWLLMAVSAVLFVALAADAVTSVLSWRRLSAKLSQVRDEAASQANEHLAGLSEKVLAEVPDEAIEQAKDMQAGMHAFNERIMGATDAMVETFRERSHTPRFVLDGRRGLKLAAERVKLTFSKRDLRFFNAFPNLRIMPYEGVIRLTDLRERSRELFEAKRER